VIEGLLLALTLALAPAQQTVVQMQQQVLGPQQKPARDNTSPEATGTAIMRGRVTTVDARPLRRVQVSLSGGPLDGPRTASTNGQGQFEVRGLPSGRYTLSATRAGYLRTMFGESHPGEPGRPIEVADGQLIENLDITLPRTGVIMGTVLDEAGDPDAGVTVVPMQMRFSNGKRRLVPLSTAISDDIGQYRVSNLPPGEYYVEAISRDKWETDPPDKKMMGFLPTFYPSAQSVGEAQHVKLKLGQQLSGIDVGLIPGKLVTISGTAANSQGMPLAGESIRVSTVLQGESFSSFFSGNSGKVGPDGTFAIHDVSPGVYTLAIQTQSAAGAAESAQMSISAMSDVEGVQLVTSNASTVAGRVVLDPASTLPANFPLTRMTVRAQLTDDSGHVNMMGFMAGNGKVGDDGSFTVENVSGRNRFTVQPLPQGWAVKRVDYEGSDIVETGTDPRGQNIDGLLITLTDKFPTLNGTLRDEKGDPAPTALAIVFPEDPALWDSALNTVRVARVDQTGVFSLRALRPGGYLVVALPTVDGNEWRDPDFLESIRARAARITVGEGETKQIVLTVKSAPQ
jgi:hypothetical protein